MERNYNWWCRCCERGVGASQEDEKELVEDDEGYVLCPRCDDRLIGFDERDE